MLNDFVYEHFMESEVLTTEEHEILIQCSRKVLAHLKRNLERERDGSSKPEKERNILIVEQIIENHELHLRYSDKKLTV